MIIVEARLTHGSTYFAGEDVECQLCFTNPPREQGGIRLSRFVYILLLSVERPEPPVKGMRLMSNFTGLQSRHCVKISDNETLGDELA